MARLKRLERTQVVHGSLEHVFDFFRQPENLAAITPAWQRFEILTPSPVPMHVGARIEYRLQVLGRAIRWTSEITEYAPPRGFVDVQVRGPYAHWSHRHAFEALGSERVRMVDTVDYALPLWPLSELGGSWWVARELRAIFDFRRAAVERLLGSTRD